MWRGLGVAGCCAPCQGSMEVWGVARCIGDVAGQRWWGLGVTVRRRVAGCSWRSGVLHHVGDVAGWRWQGLGVAGGMGVSNGGALHAMLGQHGGGLVIEVLRAVLGQHAEGLVHCVGAARWVGGGGISGHDEGGLCA
ncbi:hypothetical protein EDB83DRAFT_2321660 [Lactarius deliciosus]|nr:hypothetical protein EDB83DRAFT_2321660 [Lactarius deliciosus]